MDEAAQWKLKVRFIQLTVLLNAIIIFIAIAVLLFFWVPTPAGRAVMAVLLAAAAGLFLYFTRLYRRTKQWLDAEHRKSAEKSPGEEEAGAGDGGERTE
jgi:fatty acid desaturase